MLLGLLDFLGPPAPSRAINRGCVGASYSWDEELQVLGLFTSPPHPGKTRENFAAQGPEKEP